VLFFAQKATYAKTAINKLADSDPGSKEDEREYAFETNPFINFKFKGGYLDFGILMELAFTSMNNTRTRWNSASGSDQKDVLWTTSPYSDWSPSWENFSKGSSWFFATGFESYSSIGIYKRLSLLLRLTVLRKFTRINKIYGESVIPDGGSSFEFHQTHKRNNFRNETWMTGSFGISYGWGPVQIFCTLQLPLAYLIKQRTKLHDNTSQLFDHSKRNLWQVQEPTTMRILFVYALGE